MQSEQNRSNFIRSQIHQKLSHIPVIFQMAIWFLSIFVIVRWAATVLSNLQVAYLISIVIIGILFRMDQWVFRLTEILNPWSWVLVVTLMLLYGLALAFAGAKLVLENAGTLIAGFLVIAINAMWEEVVFRGVLFAQYIQNRKWRQTLWIMTMSTILFTATHIINFQTSSQADTYIVLVFLMGIILCQIYLLTSNLFFTALLHTMINATNRFFITNLGSLGSSGSIIIIGLLVFTVLGLVLLMWWQGKILDTNLSHKSI